MNRHERLFGPNNHSKYRIGWKEISTEKQREIRALILSRYTFDRASSVYQVKESELSSNNFKVAVQRGGRLSLVLLRKYVRVKDAASIHLVNKVLWFLKARGVRVPLSIPTRDNKHLFSFKNNNYQLYRFIPGNHFRGTVGELIDVAREIARLHRALKTIPFKDEIRRKPQAIPPWNMNEWKQIFNSAEKSKTGIYHVIYTYLGFLREEIERVGCDLPNNLRCPSQVIHGDLHPHNTICDRGKIRAFIDFERVGIRERIREIANTCHRFVRQFVVNQNKDWQRTLPKGLEIFLNEYAKFNTLEKKEVRLIPVFIRDELLRKLFSDLILYHKHKDQRNLANGELEKKLTLLKEASEIEKAMKKILT